MRLKHILFALFMLSACVEEKPKSDFIDKVFLADGDSMIISPEHLGIVNGLATVGVNHDYVGVVSGLWAQPFVSSDFYVEPRIFGEKVKTEHYTWLPFQVRETGSLKKVALASEITMIYGKRAGVVTLKLRNEDNTRRDVPLQLKLNDPETYRISLDYVQNWGFDAPVSRTWTADSADSRGVLRLQGELTVAVGCLPAMTWEEPSRRFHGNISLAPKEEKTIQLVFAVGQRDNAVKERDAILNDVEESVNEARRVYRSKVENIFAHLPTFHSDNKALEQLYYRSLVVFITNRAEAPELALHPHYSTGAVKGGCTCNYLWNYGQIRGIMPLLDPVAHREHILQFLKSGCIDSHYAFYPMSGEPFGAWYLVNHEKITGLTYDYIRLTGDVAFLGEEVNDGKTVLDLMRECAAFGDEPSKPVSLINYATLPIKNIDGWLNSHLELRRTELGYEYSYVMPDANGRRWHTWYKVAEMCRLAGAPQPQMMERAEQLRVLLKKELWNLDTQWFDFINKHGEKETRWTVQMYKLFEGDVLDADEQRGLLSHLNEDEFFSEYGMHSMSKKDPAYDQVDVDNGGGGICTSFPPLIAQFLYRKGYFAEADGIMRRLLWWGARMPYWGDSQLANEIDYRHDTPLQSDIDSGCLAQCILFGVCGIDADFNGAINIQPAKTSLANRIELRDLHIRGITLDLKIEGDKFQVTCDGETQTARIGDKIEITK